MKMSCLVVMTLTVLSSLPAGAAVKLLGIPSDRLLQTAAAGTWKVTRMACASSGFDILAANNKVGKITFEIGIDYVSEALSLPKGRYTESYKIKQTNIDPDITVWDLPPGSAVEDFVAKVYIDKDSAVTKCEGVCKGQDRVQMIMTDGRAGMDIHYYRPATDSVDNKERLVVIATTLDMKLDMLPGVYCNESDVVMTTLRRVEPSSTK